MNSGLWLALVSTVLLALGDLSKKRLVATCDPLLVLFIHLPVAILIALAYLSGSFSTLTLTFSTIWPAFLVGAVLLLAEIAFLRSMKESEISLVLPLGALMPVCAMILGIFCLGEKPSWMAAGGSILTIVGSYLLFEGEANSTSIFAPLKSIMADKGARYMVFGKIAAAVVLVLFKLFDATGSPMMFLSLVFASEWLIILCYYLSQGSFRREFGLLQKMVDNLPLLLLSGVFWGAGLAGIYLATSLTYVVYVTVIVQLELLIVVPLGAILFKEKSLHQRLSACVVMLVGVIIVVLAGH